MLKHAIKGLGFINSPTMKIMYFFTIIFVGLFYFSDSFADGVDLLAGSDADWNATMRGTGRRWLIWFDAGVAGLTFAKSKNPVVLGSVAVMLAFINIVVVLATK